MREMKDSHTEWLECIPQEWELSNIGTLYSMRNTKVSDRDYQPLSVTMKGVVPQLETAAKSDAHDDRKLVKKGDFAINSRSDRRGSCGIADRDGSVSLINTILAPRSEMNPDYYNWLFHTSQFADEFYRWGHGIVDDLWTTRWQEMKKIDVPIPCYTEQHRIADHLDTACSKVDALIANQQAQIEKLKAYKQSLITEVVTHGLDPDAPMKDSGVEWIGMIPEGWKISRVGLHYAIILGKMLCPTQVDETYTQEQYFCAANVHFGKINMAELKEMWFSPEEKEMYKVLVGDMLIVEGGAGAGGCAIVHESTTALVQNSIMIVRSKLRNDNRYLCYWIESLVKRKYLDVVCNKATIPHFTKDKLARTSLPCPPFHEQQQIAEYLDDKCAKIDALIAIKQQKTEKLTQYKKSLIYEYVTGKKEVI